MDHGTLVPWHGIDLFEAVMCVQTQAGVMIRESHGTSQEATGMQCRQ